MSEGRSLQEWLAWQESLHLSAIDLGLDRIGEVARRMGLLKPDFPVITCLLYTSPSPRDS